MAATDLRERAIEERLKPTCGRCNGTGKTFRHGFASAGDMDAGNEPHEIAESCRICQGRGWVYLPADELTEMLTRAESEVAQAKELLEQASAHLWELAEAWREGALDEHDGQGGTRSNRNMDLLNAIRRFLAAKGRQ